MVKISFMVGLVALQLMVMLPLVVTAPLPLGADAAQCGDFVSCTSCAAQSGCGWCAYLFECLPGNVNGSTSGTCTDEWTVWTYDPASCPTESPFPSLCTSKPCSECVASTFCGWCGSVCIPGTSSSPYYGSCSPWYFNHCPVVLARNVWWLWAMFAFLLLSILLTVRNMLRIQIFQLSVFLAPISFSNALIT